MGYRKVLADGRVVYSTKPEHEGSDLIEMEEGAEVEIDEEELKLTLNEELKSAEKSKSPHFSNSLIN